MFLKTIEYFLLTSINIFHLFLIYLFIFVFFFLILFFNYLGSGELSGVMMKTRIAYEERTGA